MIVPQHWAEARLQQRVGKRQFTVRRFGWSDESQERAQAHADERAQEALRKIQAGQSLSRRDLKRAYNGSEGVPIREEIVARHDDVVLTRNSYGAVCLNVSDVLFADIDFVVSVPSWWFWSCTLGLALFVVGFASEATTWKLTALAGVVALPVGAALATIAHRLWLKLAGGPERVAMKRIEAFVAANPDWHLRVYRTPAGLRTLAMQRTFDPLEPATAEFFVALGVDPIYARMCFNQRCFRARVSPKPWRIGVSAHLKPRPGVWPLPEERLPERRRWIADYDRAAEGFASCRFVAMLGSGRIHPKAAEVQRLHDDLCRAESQLPIA